MLVVPFRGSCKNAVLVPPRVFSLKRSTTGPFAVKPWPNGLPSRFKLKTWVHLRLRLARLFVHLRWIAMTCAFFGRDQICTQVGASFSPFRHSTQVNASWETSINLVRRPYPNQKYRVFLTWNGDLRVLARKLASPFGHPERNSPRKFNFRLLATTCESVWPGLNVKGTEPKKKMTGDNLLFRTSTS